MSDGERQTDGMRVVAERLARRLAGSPGVVRLRVVLDLYDRAGGGLIASGLAYTSLLAILPGLLLGLAVLGWLVRDSADQEQIVTVIAQTVPPFRDLAGVAFEQVSSGAVPTSILAIVTLLWGSSRFYANLDTALSRVFLGAPRRSAVAQTARGVALVAILVVLSVALVTAGSVMTWFVQSAPEGQNLSAALATVVQLASPIGSLVAFVLAVALCYRYVPSERVTWRALRLPAAMVGLALALLTQVYTFIAPRLVGVAAVYGTLVAAFALLAWLSIAFNLLLLGAAWTDVRAGESSPTEGVVPRFEPSVARGQHVREELGVTSRSGEDPGGLA